MDRTGAPAGVVSRLPEGVRLPGRPAEYWFYGGAFSGLRTGFDAHCTEAGARVIQMLAGGAIDDEPNGLSWGTVNVSGLMRAFTEEQRLRGTSRALWQPPVCLPIRAETLCF